MRWTTVRSKQRASAVTERDKTMQNIQSILAVTDLSIDGNLAMERAARLALAHGATLQLMYAGPAGSPPRLGAASHLAQLAREMSSRLGLAIRTVEQAVNSVADIAAQARSVDLLVLAHRRDRTLGARFLGQPVERLLRQCRCLVLVTRVRPRRHYDRIVVAVNLGPASQPLLELAGRFDAQAEIALFHALGEGHEAKLRYASVSEAVIDAHLRERLHRARARMAGLGRGSDARRNRVMSAIGRGDPARQLAIQQDYLRADLVVIGRQRRSLLAEWLCPGTAQQLLGCVGSDVLVVPEDAVAATRPRAKQRLEAERAVGFG